MTTTKTERKPKGLGGWRPGAGGKRRMDKSIKITFFMEAADVARLDALVEGAQAVVAAANATLPTRYRDDRITRGELARKAVERYLENIHPIDGHALTYRPALGQVKTEESNRYRAGALFEDRASVNALIDVETRERALDAVAFMNVTVDAYNRRAEFKKDHDAKIVVSELYREAVLRFVDAYGGQPERLAHELRPFLGKRERG